MKKIALGAAAAFAMIASPAFAGSASELVGTWTWEDYTIEVKECAETTVCGTVTAGPKNVGMEMFQSKPVADGDGWKGKIAHPATGETYFSKYSVSGDKWTLSGCTKSGTCAEGTFTRQ